MKFSRQELLDILYENEGGKVIVNKVIEVSRWSLLYEFVFEKDGRTYMTEYREGSTEYQFEGPWDCETEVVCREVIAVEQTVIVYQPISAA